MIHVLFKHLILKVIPCFNVIVISSFFSYLFNIFNATYLFSFFGFLFSNFLWFRYFIVLFHDPQVFLFSVFHIIYNFLLFPNLFFLFLNYSLLLGLLYSPVALTINCSCFYLSLLCLI